MAMVNDGTQQYDHQRCVSLLRINTVRWIGVLIISGLIVERLGGSNILRNERGTSEGEGGGGSELRLSGQYFIWYLHLYGLVSMLG